VSIEIFDRGKEWDVVIKDEKWKFDDLQTMVNVVEKFEQNLNFLVEYQCGIVKDKKSTIPRRVRMDINQTIHAENKNELNSLLRLIIDTKIKYGRWK
jgi:hypothetical protein